MHDMTTIGAGSGNPGGRPHGSRNSAILNEEFIAALLRHFRREGERAISRMAGLNRPHTADPHVLVPRQLKLQHRNAIAGLSDEQLEAMIEELTERIARRAAGSDAKLIEGGRDYGTPGARRGAQAQTTEQGHGCGGHRCAWA